MIKAMQVFWGIGVAAWNAYGMYQLQHGGPTPGPTSSWAVAIGGLIIAAVFGLQLLRGQKWLYILVCLACALMGAGIIYGAFTKDPSLWPSETWRWAGIILNGIGVVACVAAVVSMFKNPT